MNGKKKDPKVLQDRKDKEEAKKSEGNLIKNWTDEDFINLKKAMAKFPTGTLDRWRVIATEIGYSQKEVIAKAKDIQAR
jgi:hypothetical protein